MKDQASTFTNSSGSFPNTLGVDVSAPGAGDGTEWIAEYVNCDWGYQQHLMTKAGLTPNGVTEANGASQIYTAMQRCFSTPGELVPWLGPGDPAVSGHRMLRLDGSVLTIASYPDIVAATYIGDGNNYDANYIGFFKTSDAGGTLRDHTGAYFVLPDYRGLFLRGIDPLAIYDPDGASRGIPNLQQDAQETHGHELRTLSTASYAVTTSVTLTGSGGLTLSGSPGADRFQARDLSAEMVGGTPNDYETRPLNANVDWCVRY